MPRLTWRVRTAAAGGGPLYAVFLSSVFFPTRPGSYVPVVFVPGLFGSVYAELYTDVLSQLASHGYIVVGVDLKWPIEDEHDGAAVGDGPERTLKAINYVSQAANIRGGTVQAYTIEA